MMVIFIFQKNVLNFPVILLSAVFFAGAQYQGYTPAYYNPSVSYDPFPPIPTSTSYYHRVYPNPDQYRSFPQPVSKDETINHSVQASLPETLNSNFFDGYTYAENPSRDISQQNLQSGDIMAADVFQVHTNEQSSDNEPLKDLMRESVRESRGESNFYSQNPERKRAKWPTLTPTTEVKRQADKMEFIHRYPVEEGNYFDIEIQGNRNRNKNLGEKENIDLKSREARQNTVLSSLFTESLPNGNVALKKFSHDNSPVISVLPPEILNQIQSNPKEPISNQIAMTTPEDAGNEFYSAWSSSLLAPLTYENAHMIVEYYPLENTRQPEEIHVRFLPNDFIPNPKPTQVPLSLNNIDYENVSQPRSEKYSKDTVPSINAGTLENPLISVNFGDRLTSAPKIPQVPKQQRKLVTTRKPLATSTESAFHFPSFSEAKKLRGQGSKRKSTTPAPKISIEPELKETRSKTNEDPIKQHNPSNYKSASPTPPVQSSKNVRVSHRSKAMPLNLSESFVGQKVQPAYTGNTNLRELSGKTVPQVPQAGSIREVRIRQENNFNKVETEGEHQRAKVGENRKIKARKPEKSNSKVELVKNLRREEPLSYQQTRYLPHPVPVRGVIPTLPEVFTEKPFIKTRVTSSVRVVQKMPNGIAVEIDSKKLKNVSTGSNLIRRLKSVSKRLKSWPRMQLNKVAAYLHRVSRRFHDSIGMRKARRVLRKHPLYTEFRRREKRRNSRKA